MPRILLGLALIVTVMAATLAYWQVQGAARMAGVAAIVAARHIVAPATAAPDAIILDLAALRQGEPVPRRFYRRLPVQLQDSANVSTRKALFISTMLPLILRANEIIDSRRARIIDLEADQARGRPISARDRAWLRRIAARHGLGGKDRPDDIDFDALLLRVDQIPVPLALAQAALESGWGRSRFAIEGNALFGEWTWDEQDQGIVPQNRPAGRRYRVKAFDLLLQSVLSYAETLNSGRAFQAFRRERANARQQARPVDSRILADTLDAYSERGDHYGQELRQIMRRNRFADFAALKLTAPGS